MEDIEDMFKFDIGDDSERLPDSKKKVIKPISKRKELKQKL